MLWVWVGFGLGVAAVKHFAAPVPRQESGVVFNFVYQLIHLRGAVGDEDGFVDADFGHDGIKELRLCFQAASDG